MLLNIPTSITVLRIIAVPVVVWFIVIGHVHAAFWLFVAAGVSDGVDGFLARRWNQRTELGAYLDPLADKALLMSIYVTLALGHVIPAWLAIAVVFRDVMILGGIMLAWVLGQPFTIKPLIVSKVNTAAQIVFAAFALGVTGFELGAAQWLTPLGWITGALTLISAAAYLAAWMRHVAGPEERA
jgi:cardiolipin synthase (CMP-forming)